LKPRVLIVDDEPLARQRVEDMLSEDGRFELIGQSGDGLSAARDILAQGDEVRYLVRREVRGRARAKRRDKARQLQDLARLRHLVEKGDQHQLLTRRPLPVAIPDAVSTPDESHCRTTVEMMRTGREAEAVRAAVEPVVRRVIDRVRVDHVDPADLVDHRLEAADIHHGVVVDGDADEVLNLFDKRRVGGVRGLDVAARDVRRQRVDLV